VEAAHRRRCCGGCGQRGVQSMWRPSAGRHDGLSLAAGQSRRADPLRGCAWLPMRGSGWDGAAWFWTSRKGTLIPAFAGCFSLGLDDRVCLQTTRSSSAAGLRGGTEVPAFVSLAQPAGGANGAIRSDGVSLRALCGFASAPHWGFLWVIVCAGPEAEGSVGTPAGACCLVSSGCFASRGPWPACWGITDFSWPRERLCTQET